MDRLEFEALRDHGNKIIRTDIRFSNVRATRPTLVVDGITIENDNDVDLRLNISFNPETGAAKFNVHSPGVGPICRLDVGGPAHRPAGRSHKHSLRTEACPRRNLPDEVIDRPELLGRSVEALFTEFCTMANVRHEGVFVAPDKD